MRSHVAAALLAVHGSLASLPLPGGEGGVGFDDLRYSPELRRLLVPAGRTGRLDLVDPATGAVESITGFSASRWSAGHGDGTTSADAGAGLVFASDRTARTVEVVDPGARRIVARARLEGGPDYVPGADSADLTVLAVGSRGDLSPLGSVPTAPGAHCVAADDAGNAWVCDPAMGRLLVVHDPFPAGR